MLNPEFWRGRRVFVTGHTGFKGSWLCLWLNHMGAEVYGYALPPPTDRRILAGSLGRHRRRPPAPVTITDADLC